MRPINKKVPDATGTASMSNYLNECYAGHKRRSRVYVYCGIYYLNQLYTRQPRDMEGVNVGRGTMASHGQGDQESDCP